MPTEVSMKEARRKLRYRWWFGNVGALIVAFVFFSIIGHGFTGSHGDDLTPAQNIAHTIGLIVVGLIVFPAQRIVIKPWRQVSGRRIIIATIVFTAAFQFGAMTFRPPVDWILGFTVLGTAAWIRLSELRGQVLIWTIATTTGFWVGMALTVPVMFTAIRGGLFNPDSPSLLDHTITWALGAGMTGIFGGYVSGWSLCRLLLSAESHDSAGR